MEHHITKYLIATLTLTVLAAGKSEEYYYHRSSIPCKLYQPQDQYQLDCKSRGLETIPSFPNGYITSVDMSCNELHHIPSSAFHSLAASLLSIDIERNWLTNITGSPFSTLKLLATLRLSHNKLEHLDYAAFRGLKNLRLLDLSGNRLASFPDGLFDDLTSLHTLDFSSNLLTAIPCNILSPLISLQTLALKMNRFQSVICNSLNLPNLQHLTIGQNWHTSLVIRNNTFQSYSSSPLKSLELDWLYNVKMEVGTLQPLKSLTHLSLSHAAIASLNLLDSKLQSLTIKRSTEEMFPDRSLKVSSLKPLVKFNRTLSNLTLSSSLLRIKGAVFATFPHLRVLNLSHNYLYNFADNTFDGLPNLQILDLSHNNLGDLPLSALDSLASHANITHLFLAGNRLRPDALSDLTTPFTSLHHLDFSKNKDTRPRWSKNDKKRPRWSHAYDQFRSNDRNLKDKPFPAEWIRRMQPISQFNLVTFAPHIQTVNFKGTPVDITTVTNCSHITDLDFSQCEISRGDEFTQKFSKLNLPNLQILKLSGNQITKVTKEMFRATPLLENLDLRDNNIMNIDSGTFSSLRCLANLNLENNRVLSVDGINNIPKIRNLYLGQNIISTIPDNFLSRSNFPDLRVLDISANPFSCDSTIHYFSTWIKTNDLVLLEAHMTYTCASPIELIGKTITDINPSDYNKWLVTPTQKFLFIGVPIMVIYCFVLFMCYCWCCHNQSTDGIDYDVLRDTVIESKV